MSNLIKDGKGRGYLAEVNSKQRLRTESTNLSNLFTVSLEDESAFALPTGFVPLTTTGSYSAILYANNTATKSMHISTLTLSSSVITQWQLLVMPTGGTITSGTLLKTVNINLASEREINIDGRLGFDGATATGGVLLGSFTTLGTGQLKIDGAMIVPRNKSIVLLAKPSAATDVSADLFIYFDIAR